ncbi:MAG TPA: 4'-phosphopantetheinyl transferase superfamily protein [Flavobacteriaceae bacterium]|nr:4'-phosphopantetheinyl transferase superfamily protein [Flavobacteriaceae bacterium]
MYLNKGLNNFNQYSSKLNQLKGQSQRKQFLSILQLLQLKNLSFEDLKYNKSGKPELDNNFISITHSFDYSGIILSDRKVGIDIEKLRPSILKISKKFINQHEINLIGELSIENLTKVWTIKEAIFKAFGFSGIDFKKNIIIESINTGFQKANVKINKNNKVEYYDVEIISFSQYICSIAI